MADDLSPMEQVMAAIKSIETIPKFSHPQYIEGALYLTREQHSELIKLIGQEPIGLEPPRPMTGGIPVIVIKPEGNDLPSGKKLIYSGVTKEIYVFDPHDPRIHEFPQVSPLAIIDRYPLLKEGWRAWP
jgi:hypothetical protein